MSQALRIATEIGPWYCLQVPECHSEFAALVECLTRANPRAACAARYERLLTCLEVRRVAQVCRAD